MDERTTDVPSYNMHQVYLYISTLRRQHTKALLAATLSPFPCLLYPPNPWSDWCVKVDHATGVYAPYYFLLTSHKNQISVSAVQMSLQMQLLKDLECWSDWSSNPMISRSADLRYPNWANQVAVAYCLPYFLDCKQNWHSTHLYLHYSDFLSLNLLGCGP